MKDCEVIADRLSKAGWRSGCISSTDHKGRQFWVVAAERENAERFVVHADEKLTAFVELESAVLGFEVISLRSPLPARRSKCPFLASCALVL
jgi:hypothetical protein